MTTPIDGGPAYPTGTWEYDSNGNVRPYQEPGMSLLDKIAIAAMQELLPLVSDNGRYLDSTKQEIAEKSYDMADAMLAERAKRMEP